jgi:AcrR family transcriptional regulator
MSRQGERSRGTAPRPPTRTAVARPRLLAREDLPPGPTQARSTQNRRRLKAAALVLFQDRGYRGTSIDDIVARAKVPVGGFYLHFRSKRQLLLVLMDDLLEALSQVTFDVPAHAHPRETVAWLLRRAFARDLEFFGAYRAWQEAVLSDRECADHDAAIHRWTQRRVIAVFERLLQLPGARRGIDVRVLGSLMDRLYWTLLGEALSLTKRDVDRRARSAAEVTYHALFLDSPGENV